MAKVLILVLFFAFIASTLGGLLEDIFERDFEKGGDRDRFAGDRRREGSDIVKEGRVDINFEVDERDQDQFEDRRREYDRGDDFEKRREHHGAYGRPGGYEGYGRPGGYEGYGRPEGYGGYGGYQPY